MSPAAPLVSIIVPTYEMGRFLPETLDSIFAQDHRPLEVIVVDGASRDDTVAVLQRAAAEHPELRFISEPDEGPEDAINKGLALITGDIAAIQSADDVYLPGAIRAAVQGFDRHPEAGIVYGDAKMIDVHGGHVSGPTRYLPWSLERYLVGSTFIPQSSAFFRPQAARAVGGVRRRYFVFDIDLWLRMVLAGAVPVKIPGVLSAYRRHDAQRDQEAGAIHESYRRLLAETPELHQRSLRTRLAAAAGWRMLTQHYNPSDNPRHATVQVWLAMLVYPPAARGLVKPRTLIPPPPTWRGALRRLGLAKPGA